MKMYPPPRSTRKTAKEWIGLILGWAFILVALFALIYMISNAKKVGELVCNRSAFSVSLTQFGSCHTE